MDILLRILSVLTDYSDGISHWMTAVAVLPVLSLCMPFSVYAAIKSRVSCRFRVKDININGGEVH